MKIYFKDINPIVIHILCWMLIILISLLASYNRFQVFPQDYQYYVRTGLEILIFYLNFSLLVPRLLLNNKILLYVVVSIAFIFLLSFLNNQLIPSEEIVRRMMMKRAAFSGHPEGNPLLRPNRNIFMGVQIIFGILLFTVGASIKLVSEWYKNEKTKALVETQKINTELSFLKTQLNPHFLFNSLNSIYSLANKKSDFTTDAIITLSELMRYMLYETDKEYVPLAKEIEYIKNYISLQNLRLKDSAGVRFNVRGSLEHYIEPLMLSSFIENAFKYGTDYTGKTSINIEICIDGQQLILNSNNYVSKNEKNKASSGIGLQNIKSRLNLLYPDSHSLKIEEAEKLYSVELVLNLKK